MSSRSIYFHEDDYCQIQILPAKNRDFCAQQIGEIEDFSEKHAVPGGAGWTDMYIRSEEPEALLSLGLKFEEISNALSPSLPLYDHVETGYSSYRETCKNTKAFGIDEECVIYISYNDVGIVEQIWLGICGPDQSRQQALLNAFEKLSQLAELLFVDWGWDCLFPLNDPKAIQQYLQERETAFNEI